MKAHTKFNKNKISYLFSATALLFIGSCISTPALKNRNVLQKIRNSFSKKEMFENPVEKLLKQKESERMLKNLKQRSEDGDLRIYKVKRDVLSDRLLKVFKLDKYGAILNKDYETVHSGLNSKEHKLKVEFKEHANKTIGAIKRVDLRQQLGLKCSLSDAKAGNMKFWLALYNHPAVHFPLLQKQSEKKIELLRQKSKNDELHTYKVKRDTSMQLLIKAFKDLHTYLPILKLTYSQIHNTSTLRYNRLKKAFKTQANLACNKIQRSKLFKSLQLESEGVSLSDAKAGNMKFWLAVYDDFRVQQALLFHYPKVEKKKEVHYYKDRNQSLPPLWQETPKGTPGNSKSIKEKPHFDYSDEGKGNYQEGEKPGKIYLDERVIKSQEGVVIKSTNEYNEGRQDINPEDEYTIEGPVNKTSNPKAKVTNEKTVNTTTNEGEEEYTVEGPVNENSHPEVKVTNEKTVNTTTNEGEEELDYTVEGNEEEGEGEYTIEGQEEETK